SDEGATFHTLALPAGRDASSRRIRPQGPAVEPGRSGTVIGRLFDHRVVLTLSVCRTRARWSRCSRHWPVPPFHRVAFSRGRRSTAGVPEVIDGPPWPIH